MFWLFFFTCLASKSAVCVNVWLNGVEDDWFAPVWFCAGLAASTMWSLWTSGLCWDLLNSDTFAVIKKNIYETLANRPNF